MKGACAEIARIRREVEKQNGGSVMADAAPGPGQSNAGAGEGGGGATGQSAGEVKVEKDPVLADINKRVLEAFDIFDHDGNKTVDVRLEHYG